ncbi:MAG: ATP-dependent zinc protease [Planctomycetes bacterium]|nr:ATP-dependent zinc protease [Planctomycetota bacterium]
MDLPDWGLKRVLAKIDTGANTSVIDVRSLEHLPDDRVRFEVVYRTKPTRRTRWIEAEAVRWSVVKNTGGKPQERVVCRTKIRIGELEQMIELSLVARPRMRCRMLIGRRALKGVFLVDPAHVNVLTPRRVTTSKSKPSNKSNSKPSARKPK